jgi:hypothetical protein
MQSQPEAVEVSQAGAQATGLGEGRGWSGG